MKVWATMHQQVEIDLLAIIENLNVLPDGGEFIKIENGKPILYQEVSAGMHSFERAIREMTKEEYNVLKAKETLIKFLQSKK